MVLSKRLEGTKNSLMLSIGDKFALIAIFESETYNEYFSTNIELKTIKKNKVFGKSFLSQVM